MTDGSVFLLLHDHNFRPHANQTLDTLPIESGETDKWSVYYLGIRCDSMCCHTWCQLTSTPND